MPMRANKSRSSWVRGSHSSPTIWATSSAGGSDASQSASASATGR
jgi:hypothetical protein